MRIRRKSDRSRLPSSPGWYDDGSGSLRYYSRLGWTERTRPLPKYADLPGFSNLPPYRIKSKPRTKTHMRRGISIAIALILTVSALTQMSTFWSSTTKSSKFVPLISDQGFDKTVTHTCSTILPPQPSIALTGAQYSSTTGAFTYLNSPFQNLSKKVLLAAERHNKVLYADLVKIDEKFKSLPPYPGSESAVTTWINAWTAATGALAAYNKDLTSHSSTTRADYKTAAADLEWINIFSKANALNSCAVFSTELF